MHQIGRKFVCNFRVNLTRRSEIRDRYIKTCRSFNANPQNWVVEEESLSAPRMLFLPCFNPSGNNVGQECAFVTEAAMGFFCNHFIPGTDALRKIPNITRLGIKSYKLATLHAERGKLRKPNPILCFSVPAPRRQIAWGGRERIARPRVGRVRALRRAERGSQKKRQCLNFCRQSHPTSRLICLIKQSKSLALILLMALNCFNRC